MCFATLSSLKGYLLYLESILLMKHSDVSLGTPLLPYRYQNPKFESWNNFSVALSQTMNIENDY